MARSVATAIIWFVLLLPLIALPLVVLRKKGCTAEINVIWYAFSLVFVFWGCISIVVGWGVLGMLEFDAMGLIHFYQNTAVYLTDVQTELSLVTSLIIIAIAPQLLTYVLSGLSGCASTPRLVWQFEKIAIWSLIKFLAALGGYFIAEALVVASNITKIPRVPEPGLEPSLIYVEYFLEGLGWMALAFGITVLQVFLLEAAHALGQAWKKQPKSWPYLVHRFFTRHLPRDEDLPSDDAGT